MSSPDNASFPESGGAPIGRDLDLITAISRLRQVDRARRSGLYDDCEVELLLDRIMGSDVPRLIGHVAPEALRWADEAVPGWRA